MTPIEIRAAIKASAGLTDLAHQHQTQAIADTLSVGMVKVVTRHGGIGTILEALGADTGAALLDGLFALRDTNPAVKWAWSLIDRGELDFGSPATRAMIVRLKDEGKIPPDIASALLALAEVPDPVDEFDVRVAIFADDGSLMV